MSSGCCINSVVVPDHQPSPAGTIRADHQEYKKGKKPIGRKGGKRNSHGSIVWDPGPLERQLVN